MNITPVIKHLHLLSMCICYGSECKKDALLTKVISIFV